MTSFSEIRKHDVTTFLEVVYSTVLTNSCYESTLLCIILGGRSSRGGHFSRFWEGRGS